MNFGHCAHLSVWLNVRGLCISAFLVVGKKHQLEPSAQSLFAGAKLVCHETLFIWRTALIAAVLPENILWLPLVSEPAALEIIFHICLHIALINASSRSLWALKQGDRAQNQWQAGRRMWHMKALQECV